VGQLTHESDELKAGVFSYFFCEGLRKLALKALTPISVFNVFDYADEQIQKWAQRNKVKQQPRPRMWPFNRPTVYLTPGQIPEDSEIPPTYTDEVSRTGGIVHVLEGLLARQKAIGGGKYCIRICAGRSSFAISPIEPPDKRRPELKALYLKERACLIQLLKHGATFKVLLTRPRVSAPEMRTWDAAAFERNAARITQLRDFCQEVVMDPDLARRFCVIWLSIPERNLLFLGDEYYFEGRRLHVTQGFEATRVVTDAEEIRREMQAFDALFDSGIRYICAQGNRRFGRSRNKELLRAVIHDLEDDFKRLKSYSPAPLQ
jgi:hypothetical protein